MACLTLLDGSLAYGHVPLLNRATFSLEDGERVGLIGRNGTGKSSLLKILAGMDRPDEGTVQVRGDTAIAYVAQEPVFPPVESVFDAVKEALRPVLDLITQYSEGRGDLDALHGAIDASDGWNWEQRVFETLERLGLNPSDALATLSGGNRKRVALAQALVQRPDVLLLDEPTNHLDLDAIEWLEMVLNEFRGSIVTVTHDRSFLDRVATRIVELDRGKLLSYPGNFAAYSLAKEAQAAHEAVVTAKADKLLAQEEVWIRKGVEARRTRAQARIERLEQLRAEHAARRSAQGSVRMELVSGGLSGKLVSELTHVSLSFGQKVIVRDFSSTILRGDKVGILGPNGAGKTSLLKLILGQLSPDPAPAFAPQPEPGASPWGTVRRGTNVTVAYFDQMRHSLDLDATLEDFISPGSEWIEIGSRRQHVKSYLGDFLFAPARAAAPVRSLSGGERNRLLLARLFARPANVLVLDEPTNDLDIDTLELLEDLLQNYDGTVFLISHDRRFVDNVVTSTIAFEGNGTWREYEGGISDWLVQSARTRAAGAALVKPAKEAPLLTPIASRVTETPERQRKLSYKEQRELEALPARITALEVEQQSIAGILADGQIFASNNAHAIQLSERSAAIEEELLLALERWEALETRSR